MDLKEQLNNYIPFNHQEAQDKRIILSCLEDYPQIFFRENLLAHMTASAWVVNRNKDKVLLAYHNLYDSWSWLGGHADGEENLLNVALREVSEESGLQRLTPVLEDIYSLEVLTVDGHMKRGAYISSHLHLNITYLIEADETASLSIKPDENSGVKWFALDDAVAASTERWFQENVYKKLNEKLEILGK
ncbi:NUDIX hydrolase [Vagococcus elongatus]|uniref:NUDIX hydrolase n=1 Tax=Vagococcus elongatus TaxID=180344 RepID=A0A430AMX8_9ENTE|nr:NUDIX hydrolase [Vagococcus elongatus]RSU09471.1 NUDIX hydrolase [Vagococcus elongatus]